MLNPSKKIIQNLLLLVLTLILFFSISEFVLRCMPKPIDYITIINHAQEGPPLDMNRVDQNLRARIKTEDNILTYHPDFKNHLNTDKKKDTFRIIVVGDSFTFGNGVEKNETYSYFLEQKLNQNDGSGLKYEVLNFAMLGYDLTQINSLVQEQIPYFNPDLVIYGYSINDLNAVGYAKKDKEVVKIFEEQKIVPYLFDVPHNPWMLEHLATYRFINLRGTRVIRKMYPEYKSKEYPLSQRISENMVNQILKTCNKNNISFYILNIPPGVEGVRDRFIEPIANKNNINYLDLEWELGKYNKEDIRLGNKTEDKFKSVYFSKEGHEIIAGILYKDLKNKRLI